jgi:CHAD domain-containing protein
MRTLRKFARHSLRKLLAKVERHARAALPDGSDAELHALRIAAKRLRYNLEFFAPILGPECVAAIERLTRIQDKLGALADADAFARTYEALLAELEPGDPRRAGLKACREAAHRHRDQTRAALRASFGKTGGAAYLESVAASISAALGSLSPKSEA